MRTGYFTYPLARLGLSVEEAEAWAAEVNRAVGTRSAFVSGTALVLTEVLSRMVRL